MSLDKLQPNSSGLDDFDEAELEELYTWIDSIPLSRPKKNISRDFADGGKSNFYESTVKNLLYVLQCDR
jgi:hypothetical protein